MAIIKTLKTKTDETEQSVYPKTVLEAVVDSESNETLDVILDGLNNKIDNIETGGGSGGGDIPDNVQEQIDGKVSKSGDTMTGSLNVEGIIDADGYKRIDITGKTINCNDLTLSDGACNIKRYINKTNAGTNNMSNIPVGSAPFILDVELIRWASTTDYITRQVFISSSDGHKPRARYCTNGTWSDWTIYNLNNAVSKSGDTMTGALTVKSNVNTPLLGDNTGDTMMPTPVAGTLSVSGDYMTSSTGLKTMKSFIGSYYGGTTSATNAWNSVISVRHRNGVNDGSSHGMYLRSLMNTGNTNLIWNNQNAGTWESERTILDSRNYSSYALPLTGGKITGGLTVTDGFYSTSEQTVLYQDYYCFQCSDGAGKTGYWKLCTINVTGTYAEAIIEFDMTCKYGRGKLYLSFGGTSTDISAYTVSTFKQTGGLRQCYAVKTSGTSSGSVFDIYVQKEEAYGNLTVNHMKFPQYMRGLITLTWSGAHATSLPSGYTAAKVGNDWTTVVTATGATVNLTLPNTHSCYLMYISINNGMHYLVYVMYNENSDSYSFGTLGGGGSIQATISGQTLTMVISGGTVSTTTTIKYIELK